MRDALAVFGAWCALAFLAGGVWAVACALRDRADLRRLPKRTVEQPLVGYWDDAAEGHPHPRGELTIHVDAPDLESALKALERAS